MHRNITILSWFNFFIDFVFYSPVAVLYFANVTGSYALGMSIYSVIWISSSVFEIPTGIFSDMIGRKNTVIAGTFTSFCSVILYAIGGGYWWLAGGALLEGIGRSFYSGNNDALLHDSLRGESRETMYHRYYGKLNAYNQLGCAIVALAGGFLANISYSIVLWISLVPRFVLVLLSLFLVEPTMISKKSSNVYDHLRESLVQFRSNRRLRLLTIISAMRTAVYEGAYQFRTAFVALLWPLWAVGIPKALSHLAAMVSFSFSGSILDKMGYKQVLTLEIIINRVINITALAFPTVISPVLMSSTSLFYGVTTTAVSTLQQNEFTQKQRATLGSLSSLFGSITYGVFVVLLGFLADRIGPANALILAQISILSILYFYKELFSRKTNI